MNKEELENEIREILDSYSDLNDYSTKSYITKELSSLLTAPAQDVSDYIDYLYMESESWSFLKDKNRNKFWSAVNNAYENFLTAPAQSGGGEVLSRPRVSGKNTASFAWTIEQALNGETVLHRTPKGDVIVISNDKFQSRNAVIDDGLCKVCGNKTGCVYNINLEAVSICECCGRSIAHQEIEDMFLALKEGKETEE